MNLHPVRHKLLMNTVDATNIGAYIDSITGKKMLHFKNESFSIPYDSNTTVTYTDTTTGQVGAYVLTVDDYAPCDECENLDYAVKLIFKERVPGRNNSEFVPKLIPYGNAIPSSTLTITSGAISAANVATIVADIVDQVNDHIGADGPAAVAGAARRITSAGGGNIGITVGGTSYTGNGSDATERIAALVAAVNAGSVAYAFVDPDTATTVWFIGNDKTTLALAGESNCTIDTAVNFVGFVGEDVEKALNVSFDPDDRFTKTDLQLPVFPTLTINDVFEEFMFKPNEGSLAQLRRGNVPLAVSYRKYCFKWKTDIASLSEGAGHHNTMEHTLYLYMPYTVATSTTDAWDATNFMRQTGDSGFSADRYFAELLAWWQNDAALDKFGTARVTVTTKTQTNGTYYLYLNGILIPVPVLAAEADVAATGAKIIATVDAHPSFSAVQGTTTDIVNITATSGAITAIAQDYNGTGIVATAVLI